MSATLPAYERSRSVHATNKRLASRVSSEGRHYCYAAADLQQVSSEGRHYCYARRARGLHKSGGLAVFARQSASTH
ncbi:hypothetical protein J6590_094201 [Homalodisca vitripennis]|nr:hypothetical protein J6590_094201 [Homalodisca vitripennis]